MFEFSDERLVFLVPKRGKEVIQGLGVLQSHEMRLEKVVESDPHVFSLVVSQCEQIFGEIEVLISDYVVHAADNARIGHVQESLSESKRLSFSKAPETLFYFGKYNLVLV